MALGMGNQLLKITAKHANVANFAWNPDLKTQKEKLKLLEKYCKRYNRDYSKIRKSAGLHLAIRGAEAKVPAPYEKYSGPRKWEYKTPEEAAEFIRGYADLGIDHFVIVFPYGAEVESIKVLIDQVAPLV